LGPRGPKSADGGWWSSWLGMYEGSTAEVRMKNGKWLLDSGIVEELEIEDEFGRVVHMPDAVAYPRVGKSPAS
jgi:hypothetical protein